MCRIQTADENDIRKDVTDLDEFCSTDSSEFLGRPRLRALPTELVRYLMAWWCGFLLWMLIVSKSQRGSKGDWFGSSAKPSRYLLSVDPTDSSSCLHESQTNRLIIAWIWWLVVRLAHVSLIHCETNLFLSSRAFEEPSLPPYFLRVVSYQVIHGVLFMRYSCVITCKATAGGPPSRRFISSDRQSVLSAFFKMRTKSWFVGHPCFGYCRSRVSIQLVEGTTSSFYQDSNKRLISRRGISMDTLSRTTPLTLPLVWTEASKSSGAIEIAGRAPRPHHARRHNLHRDKRRLLGRKFNFLRLSESARDLNHRP